MTSGLRQLECWSDKAGQIEKNAAYRALFAVSNGSVFRAYDVVADIGRKSDFLVRVNDDLVLEVRLFGPDAFGILYIGPPPSPGEWSTQAGHAA